MPSHLDNAAEGRHSPRRVWPSIAVGVVPLIVVTTLILRAAFAARDTIPDHLPTTTESVSTETSSTPDAADASTPGSVPLYPDRPDRRRDDIERRVGDAAQLPRHVVTVTAAQYVDAVSDFETAGYVAVTVTIENPTGTDVPYGALDWTLTTSDGVLIEPTYVTASTIGTWDLLAPGAVVTGDVYFDIGSREKIYYVVFHLVSADPEAPAEPSARRAVWMASV